MTFNAILWDCDGCLIDSEWIACGRAAQVLTDAGYSITTEEYVRKFAGQVSDHIYDQIQRETGHDLRDKIDRKAAKESRNQAFRDNLTVIPGVIDVLNAVRVPMAVASGSSYERLELTMGIVDLYDRFAPHVYSSESVQNGKPAPDIYLYAANNLGVAPNKCLVIEDSENGVRAGVAAGMTVFGFTGGTHITEKVAHAAALRNLGAQWVFHHMDELGHALAA